MENPQQGTENRPKISFIPKLSQVFFSGDRAFFPSYEKLGQGGQGSDRLVILSLGLVNFVLLIAAIVIGANCARVKEVSLHVSHSAVAKVINELDDLRSNHSDVMEAEAEAKSALDSAMKDHDQLKAQITEKEATNENYQKQVEVLLKEKSTLQANLSALEAPCSSCPPGWIGYNSSCYFISYTASPRIKKNWPESRQDCKNREADLIVIDYPDEQRFVDVTIENMASDDWDDSYWIGLSDSEAEGTWVWVNNMNATENRYWMDGEPNNHGHQGEDCAVTAYSAVSPWKTHNDMNCVRHKRNWICERPSS